MSAAEAIFSATRGFMTSRARAGPAPARHRRGGPRSPAISSAVERDDRSGRCRGCGWAAPHRRSPLPSPADARRCRGRRDRRCPVGDVLDEARRQADERAVFVHSAVEVTRRRAGTRRQTPGFPGCSRRMRTAGRSISTSCAKRCSRSPTAARAPRESPRTTGDARAGERVSRGRAVERRYEAGPRRRRVGAPAAAGPATRSSSGAQV